MEAQTQVHTKPLLRPDQVESAKDEIKNLESKLVNKHIEDKAEVQRQLRRARRDFENQVPKAPENPDEEGRMVKRAKSLLSAIIPGMCSQEEMRKAPPGAIDKHRKWESLNKTRIMEWKHLMLRLTAGSGDREAANLERHRPTVSTLNMDYAQIQGKQIFLPDSPDGLGVRLTDAQIAGIRELDPDLADRLGSLTNRQREQVKEVVAGIGLTVDPVASALGKIGAEKRLAGKKGRKPWTQEQKDALVKRLADAREAKAAKQAQSKQ